MIKNFSLVIILNEDTSKQQVMSMSQIHGFG